MGCPHISPSTGYYRSPENEKEIIIFNSKIIITYEIKWLTIPRSVERGCQQTVAPVFGGLHSACASLQTAPLGSAHVQET
jgi:hypothetical protein